MKFVLVDRITELESGRRIVAQKALSLAEEYLADHFPAFPVMPGVLMLEALVQTAAWAVREAQDFRPSIVVLKEARNVTYRSFVQPGQVLTLEAQVKELAADHSVFTAGGTLDGRSVLKGQVELRHLNLADSEPHLAEVDEQIRRQMRGLFGRLMAPAPRGLNA